MVINWETIITAVLTSSLISTFIGIFFYSKQKKVDFIYSYRNYILEKRKDVYDSVEKVLSEITQNQEYDGGVNNHVFITEDYGENPLPHFNAKVLKCLAKRYWLSDEMVCHIEDLNQVVMTMIKECNRRRAGMIEIIDIGNEYYLQIDSIANVMSARYFIDICKLDDIKTFKEKKRI